MRYSSTNPIQRAAAKRGATNQQGKRIPGKRKIDAKGSGCADTISKNGGVLSQRKCRVKFFDRNFYTEREKGTLDKRRKEKDISFGKKRRTSARGGGGGVMAGGGHQKPSV